MVVPFSIPEADVTLDDCIGKMNDSAVKHQEA
jgi:hypothetical protein